MDETNNVNVSKAREELKQLGSDKRHNFVATFSGVGFKQAYFGNEAPIYAPTIVFKDVYCNHNLMTDHLWFNYTKGFLQLGELEQGDKVTFDGRVKSYLKGPYKHQTVDYGIERPNKAKLVTSTINSKPPMPTEKDEKNALIGYIMEENKQFYIDNDRPYEEWYVNQYHEWKKSLNKKS